jgi:hypothetical protein
MKKRLLFFEGVRLASSETWWLHHFMEQGATGLYVTRWFRQEMQQYKNIELQG